MVAVEAMQQPWAIQQTGEENGSLDAYGLHGISELRSQIGWSGQRTSGIPSMLGARNQANYNRNLDRGISSR